MLLLVRLSRFWGVLEANGFAAGLVGLVGLVGVLVALGILEGAIVVVRFGGAVRCGAVWCGIIKEAKSSHRLLSDSWAREREWAG